MNEEMWGFNVWAVGGLPMHPLFVHFTTVLVLIFGIFTIWLALTRNGELRHKLAYPAAGVGLALLVLTQLTIMTGEQLAEIGDEGARPIVHEHGEQGETVRLVLFLLVLVLIALGWTERNASAKSSTGSASTTDRRSTLGMIVRGLVGIGGIATAFTVIQAGHSGATAVWEGEIDELPSGEGGEGGESGEKGEAGESGEKGEAEGTPKP